MQKLPDVSAMDLAALLCSRVCHDVISPVGAIANGLELLDDDGDAETNAIAMDLIRSSAGNASAKLQFARIAFGAAGSSGASIDTGDAEKVALAYFSNEKKADMEWHCERALMPKNQVKLTLNMLLTGLGAIPRGGLVKVEIDDPNGTPTITITATGTSARVPSVFLSLLNGTHDEHLDAHAVQPLYTLLLARETGMDVTATLKDEAVVFRAATA